MIYNMHIRRDYRMLGTHRHTARVSTLCGKITAAKYTGVPVINSEQPAFVSDDGYDVGWCLECCAQLLRETLQWSENIRDRRLYDLYIDIKATAARQLRLASGTRSLN